MVGHKIKLKMRDSEVERQRITGYGIEIKMRGSIRIEWQRMTSHEI